MYILQTEVNKAKRHSIPQSTPEEFTQQSVMVLAANSVMVSVCLQKAEFLQGQVSNRDFGFDARSPGGRRGQVQRRRAEKGQTGRADHQTEERHLDHRDETPP